MISLRKMSEKNYYLPVEGILDTEEKVREVRIELEEKTKLINEIYLD